MFNQKVYTKPISIFFKQKSLNDIHHNSILSIILSHMIFIYHLDIILNSSLMKIKDILHLKMKI